MYLSQSLFDLAQMRRHDLVAKGAGEQRIDFAQAGSQPISSVTAQPKATAEILLNAVELIARTARSLLTSLATVAFGLNLN